MKKNIKGITLIALVITIIVLLILAGVSIAMLTGNNGLLTKAGEAKTLTELAEDKEQIQLAVIGSYGNNGTIEIEELNNNLKTIQGLKYNGESISNTNKISSLPASVTLNGKNYDIDGKGSVKKDMPTVTTPPTTAVSENTKYNDGEDVAVIPKGFKVSSDTNEQTIETGLVVKDSKENEWVWIPVDDATAMYTTEGAPYTLRGSTGTTVSKATKGRIVGGKLRTTPGAPVSEGSYREPDIISGYDTDSSAQTAGYTDLHDMAQSMAKDYENMIDSIDRNGGFYVGRYELTGSVENPTEVGGPALTDQSWYSFYKACKGFSTNEVESRMIWGCQWDMICLYISEHGEKKDITKSKTWGNHLDNSESGHGIKQDTGYKESWSANKIYDFAGNCWETTQEAYKDMGRARDRRLLFQQCNKFRTS